MTNLMRTGSAFIEQQRKAHMAETVTYRRGDNASSHAGSEISVSATVGSTEFEQADYDGFTISGEITDFLIAAADLDFGSGAVLPEFGDEIDVTGRGTFEVLRLPVDGVYRFSDPFGNTLRIHTKFIS